jgi:PHP-associated
MRLDIHTHTVHSDCSNLDVGVICRRIHEQKIPVFTVTDHGNSRACDALADSCKEAKIVYGVEVTAKEGDFLVYSLDVDYIKNLTIYQPSVRSLRRDEETAVVWAHPRIPHKHSIGWTSPCGDLDEVLCSIDGLEIFNGTMLNLAATGVVHMTYFANLKRLADNAHIATTGGSDAHDPAHFYTAWTEFEDTIKTPADFIRALKTGNVKPNYDREFYKLNVVLE